MWDGIRDTIGGTQSPIPTHATTASRADEMFAGTPAFQMHHMPTPNAGEREPYPPVNDRELEHWKGTDL